MKSVHNKVIYLQQFLSVTENSENCTMRSLPNMELLEKFLHKVVWILWTVVFGKDYE